MNSNQLAAAIARRLRNFTKRDVREILDLFSELCRDELLKEDGYVHIDGLGKLYIEQQHLHSAGFMRDQLQAKHGFVPASVPRYYFRFRPSEALRAAVLAQVSPEEER